MDLKRSMINNHLYLRELDINSIAKKYGTPIYLYDLNYVRNRVAQLRKLFNKNINIYYAVKANYSYNILNNLRGLEIEFVYNWKVGESLIVDRSHVHCSSSRIKDKKLGLTTFTKK